MRLDPAGWDAGTGPGGGFDVLGLGAVAVDDLLVVASFPRADSKAHTLGRTSRCGGLTGTALVAAARMGARCAYAGVLGTDALADRVVDHFRREQVDVGFTRRRPGIGPIRSTILIGRDDGSRTVLSDRNGFVGPDVDWPPAAVIRASKVLFVDHVGVAGQARAALLARSAGIPVVADFERAPGPDFPALLALADHLIVTRTFATELTGASDPACAARALASLNRGVAVVTSGAEGCWSAVDGEPGAPRHQPAYAVEAVDTNGCGDVFHGVYAALLALGDPLAERLRLATAAAALKASRPVGHDSIPDRAAILAFLATRPAEVSPRFRRGALRTAGSKAVGEVEG